jgi:hypothetical protein
LLLYRHAEAESDIIYAQLNNAKKTMRPQEWKPKFYNEFVVNFNDLWDPDLSKRGLKQSN